MANNFSNVTVGTGSFSINGRDVGITKGDVALSRGVETIDCESGVPLNIEGRVPIRENHTIQIPLAELTIENLSDVSLNVPATNVAGTPVTVLDGDDQERTFAALSGGAIEFIRLDGPNVTALTVKDLTEVITYVAGTDYFLDTLSGIVYRSPGSSIPKGATVRVDYTYTPPASEQLRFGTNLALQDKEVIFTHVSPVDQRVFTAFIPRAQFSGTLEANFLTEDFNLVNAEATALPSAAHPDFPLGYWEITPAP